MYLSLPLFTVLSLHFQLYQKRVLIERRNVQGLNGVYWRVALMVLMFVLVGNSCSNLRADLAGDFGQEFDLVWGYGRAKILDGGRLLTLSLDQASGLGFVSKEYLFGRIDMQLKLVAGNSAGTVTAYYLSSQGPNRDEIDFEFLGNVTGEPYIVHTNVYTRGKGGREQQFYPPSLWNALQWATRGGLLKTDWSKAPFLACFQNFNVDACVLSTASLCASISTTSATNRARWQTQRLDPSRRRWLRWVQKYYMIYNYCTDLKRFPQGCPRECRHLRV